VPTIANTMDVARSMGDGRSMGYGFSSTFVPLGDAEVFTTAGNSIAPSAFSSLFGLE
jgi:hypothetical protein